MLHIAYSAQLEIKRANVKNCLDKELKSDIEVNETVPSPDVYGYRNKIQLPIAIVDGKICAVFFAPNTHKVIPFIREGEEGKCLLNDEGMQKIISTFLTFVKENNISVYDERLHKGLIRHLVIRRVGDSYAVCAVINGKSLPSYKRFVEKLQSFGYSFSLYISANEKRTNVIMGEKTVTLYGEDKVRGNALGVTYEVSPLSFMQVNDKVRDLIYSKVGEIIKNSGIDNVIDAYSGIGIMSNIFARYAKKVYAIEIVPEAIEDAKKLAALNGNSDKIVNICGDCAKELPPLIASLGKSVVVIDPPRKGCDKAVLEAMLKARPTEIIYVSCNPATLARDLRILSDGYSIESVTPYDMFPNTKHVETLVCLSKKTEKHINIDVEFGEGEGQVSLKKLQEELNEQKPKKKTTYKDIQAYIEEKYGFKVHTAYIAEVKRDLGLPMYDAPNAVEELKRPRSHPTDEMVEAIKDALKHFEII